MTDFAEIAPYYDLMTGYRQRLTGDAGVLKTLVEKFQIRKALDAGCGSGVHSIILSKLGVEVTGLDSSDEMLDLARGNMASEGVSFDLVRGKFESLPGEWSERFDGIFCLANSLVGVETGEGLALSLKSFFRVLKPGGRAVIQLLNFPMLRKADRRIIKISTEQNCTFVRFLDFDRDETRLNVLVIEDVEGKINHKLISQPIFPITASDILAAKPPDSSDMQFFSDLTLSAPFRPDGENLVTLFIK